MRDLTGLKFNKLRPSGGRGYYWLCKCEYGNIKEMYSCHLVSGRSKSCGCLIGQNQPKGKKAPVGKEENI